MPALSETYKDFDAAAWIILLAPAGTPGEIVEQVAVEVKKALADPAVEDRLGKMGATAFGSDPATTAAFQRREIQKFKRAVEISGAKGE